MDCDGGTSGIEALEALEFSSDEAQAFALAVALYGIDFAAAARLVQTRTVRAKSPSSRTSPSAPAGGPKGSLGPQMCAMRAIAGATGLPGAS